MNELNKKLSYIKENPQIQSSSKVLDTVTTDILEEKDSQDILVELSLKENNGELSLWTSSGICINKVLPKGYVIQLIGANIYAADIKNKRLILPKDIEGKGIESLIRLSHEIGHILDPNSLARTKKRAKLLEIKEQRKLTFKEKIEVSNITLEGEAWAWHYGLALSKLFGVDIIEYEADMEQVLKNDFNKQIEKLKDLNPKKGDNRLENVVLFNPLIQDFQKINL